MKGFKTIFFLLLIVGFSSCKKETIEDPIPDQTPVFTANGSLNGNSFEIIAGENGAEMQTLTQIENGVKFYSGVLGDGSENIEFGIHEGNLDITNLSDPSNFSGALHFSRVPDEPLLVLSKDALPNASIIQEIKWYVNNIFTGTNYVEINLPGKYDVCAEVTFSDGMQSTLCNEMVVGYENHSNYKLRHYLNQMGVLKVWLDEASSMASSVQWFINDEPYCQSETLELPINAKPVKVTSTVTFNNGASRTRSILVDGSLSGKFIEDFSVFESELANPVFWDYSVIIRYRKNGVTYTSVSADNTNSSIIVNDIDYFGLNSAGNQVFKCSASVSCFVTDPSNGSQIPLNFNTQFGVEIKD